MRNILLTKTNKLDEKTEHTVEDQEPGLVTAAFCIFWLCILAVPAGIVVLSLLNGAFLLSTVLTVIIAFIVYSPRRIALLQLLGYITILSAIYAAQYHHTYAKRKDGLISPIVFLMTTFNGNIEYDQERSRMARKLKRGERCFGKGCVGDYEYTYYKAPAADKLSPIDQFLKKRQDDREAQARGKALEEERLAEIDRMREQGKAFDQKEKEEDARRYAAGLPPLYGVTHSPAYIEELSEIAFSLGLTVKKPAQVTHAPDVAQAPAGMTPGQGKPKDSAFLD